MPGAPDLGVLSRRSFLGLLGSSAALAGGGCASEADDRIVPFDREPADETPGQLRTFATSMALDGLAIGLLARSFNGRPIKLDGNPDHSSSLGATGTYHQAALRELYDPRRGQATIRRGAPQPYDDLMAEVASPLGQGEGLHLLFEPTSSPLIEEMLDRVRRKYPAAQTHFFAPTGHGNEAAGLKLLTGSALIPRYRFDQAAVVVSLDADFLDATTYPPANARQFMDGRRIPEVGFNRLYSVESTLSITGATADHRFPVRPPEVGAVANEILAEIRRTGTGRPWIRAIAKDLLAHPGKGLVVPGLDQPAQVHAVAHAINLLLKSRCVDYAASPILEAAEPSQDVLSLVDALRRGAVRTLVMFEGNPAVTIFRDYDFGALVSRVPQSVYVGLFMNETAQRTGWYIPAAHFLESWGDARAVDGTVSLVQPLLRPLYGGKTIAEVVASLLGDRAPDGHDLLRQRWLGKTTVSWDEHLRQGQIPGTATPPEIITPRWDVVTGLTTAPGASIDVQWKRSYAIHDGRFRDNAWLQELPDPITRQTWGNAAWISPATASRLGVETGRFVRLSRKERDIEIPVLIVPGHADDALTLPLGYGGDIGTDTYALRTSDVAAGFAVVEVTALDRSEDLAITQTHGVEEGRDIALIRSVRDYLGETAHVTEEAPPELFAPFPQDGAQWGMAIDLSVCTGCSACVVACQAENNSPVVGPENVLKGREMHWIRIDRYFVGSEIAFQPMLCQHCENAPCEYVCPVNATTHSPDGLNEMTYNRCVGTRFCSNNCPYKVRRFNWFNFNAHKPSTLKMMMNPDVTVRGRGVMEKCTYCVQRIREAEIRAERERRPLADLEVRTACQQACPTNAIVFGNVSDPTSAVSRQMKQQRARKVLEELNTQPRTRYLTRLKNPNPELG